MRRMLFVAVILTGLAACLVVPGCAVYYDEGYDRDRFYDGYYYGDGAYFRFYDRDGYEHRRYPDGYRHRDFDDRYEHRGRWGR